MSEVPEFGPDMSDKLDEIKTSLQEISVAGVILLETEGDDLEPGLMRTWWCENSFQSMALRQLFEVPDEKIPGKGPEETAEEYRVRMEARKYLGEHFKSGVIFLIYWDRPDCGVCYKTSYWGNRFTVRGMLKTWQDDYDSGVTKEIHE